MERQGHNGHTGGAELLHFSESLSGASSVADLARRFDAVFPGLFGVGMYGFYGVEPWTGQMELLASANVSDTFLTRYERQGRELDVLYDELVRTGRPVYNLGLMSMPEWLEHPLYRHVKRLHDIRHEIQTPVLSRDGIVGFIPFATSDPHRGFTPREVQLAEAVGRVVGAAIERIHYTERLERERDRLQAALDLAGTAVVISDRTDPEPQPNDAARRLLGEVVDGEVQLHRLIARPASSAGFSRHLEVELAAGALGFLHGHSRPVGRDGDALITVLELEREAWEIPERTLVALTPREREVALRVVDGMSDRQIAERLAHSPHTVRQYVKRTYRKLEVDSRVALTRLLLGKCHSQRRD
jgi:DNA-binding CsgD family transcriptional regulator/GAF domain-containing protein